ncbi:Dihydroorotate dehydrogenase B (NAD(+)), electron transfer subunit [Ruminococcaceae bacterium BL-6]|nr:Dihydroorotate dehydrogenase B (NAD(+)), electron transfer subunit [Ruminococcaceae bacterium BL-6]
MGDAMKYYRESCEILYKREPAKGIFDLIVDAEKFAGEVRPGQFVHVLVPGKTLRRPISVCDFDAETGIIRLVVQIRGEGTEILSKKRIGDTLDLIAPLGRGFDLGDTGRKALFVGGGIGTPPLLAAAKPFGENATVLLGFRNQDSIILARDFALAGCRVFVATDDGSMGYHGPVTDLMKPEDGQIVFACGPAPMLKKVGRFAEETGIPCQISLEQRMACGVGACLGCSFRIRKDGRESYARVCSDGPVFDSREVVWEEER